MSKNKFTNAFASALAKPVVTDSSPETITQASPSTVQASKTVDTEPSKLPEIPITPMQIPEVHTQLQIPPKPNLEPIVVESKVVKMTKKLSLKDRGWLPITIYLPLDTKQKLQIQSINQGRDMSEIVAELLAK
jgi:hypothetical protein